eukprot:TRINITY_DN119259_c0_g1_i1.p1 TRINITY_DN119259_c0_g1~~TRINITY_DN119259_c0_g1_i1.p1  ORF type:complete len:151 (-),score=26.28 TRINITY_DN119259_c0_g1_i1:227-637(-)
MSESVAPLRTWSVPGSSILGAQQSQEASCMPPRSVSCSYVLDSRPPELPKPQRKLTAEALLAASSLRVPDETATPARTETINSILGDLVKPKAAADQVPPRRPSSTGSVSSPGSPKTSAVNPGGSSSLRNAALLQF